MSHLACPDCEALYDPESQLHICDVELTGTLNGEPMTGMAFGETALLLRVKAAEAERDRLQAQVESHRATMLRAARLVHQVTSKDSLDLAQMMALGGAIEVIGIALGWPVDGPGIDTSALNPSAEEGS